MIQKKLESFINEYLKNQDYEISNWSVAINTREGFGDYSSNIALILSKKNWQKSNGGCRKNSSVSY